MIAWLVIGAVLFLGGCLLGAFKLAHWLEVQQSRANLTRGTVPNLDSITARDGAEVDRDDAMELNLILHEWVPDLTEEQCAEKLGEALQIRINTGASLFLPSLFSSWAFSPQQAATFRRYAACHREVVHRGIRYAARFIKKRSGIWLDFLRVTGVEGVTDFPTAAEERSIQEHPNWPELKERFGWVDEGGGRGHFPDISGKGVSAS